MRNPHNRNYPCKPNVSHYRPDLSAFFRIRTINNACDCAFDTFSHLCPHCMPRFDRRLFIMIIRLSRRLSHCTIRNIENLKKIQANRTRNDMQNADLHDNASRSSADCHYAAINYNMMARKPIAYMIFNALSGDRSRIDADRTDASEPL